MKSVKIVVKRFVFILCALTIIYGLIYMLNYIYVEGEIYSWARYVMHELYEEDENIDNLYLGSSHIHYNLIPTQLDELNGENNFNLSMTGQRMRGSYYLLKEASKKHDIKKVYLEMYYRVSIDEEVNIIADWRCLDFMRNGINKMQYILDIKPSENLVPTIFPFVRYRSELFNQEHIKEQFDFKMTEEYKNYRYYREIGDTLIEYKEKGFYKTTQEYREEKWVREKTFDLIKTPMDEETKEYLVKIIELCEENQIELVLFSSPIFGLEMISVQNYDFYVQQIREIADCYSIKYFDFNLVGDEYFSIYNGELFFNIDHLNVKGAELFTTFFYEVLQKEDANTDIFYETYAEKAEKEAGRVYGILYVGETESDSEKWEIASNRETGMEYRILLTPDGGETIMLQDFSGQTCFEIGKNKKGICTIVSRSIEEPNNVNTVQVRYE